MKRLFLLAGLLVSASAFAQRTSAPLVHHAPKIDGIGTDAAWALAPWQPLNKMWLGPAIPNSDASGRYKVLAAKDALYVLAEITDDILVDIHPDPKSLWWDDDCLEIFVDPDASGGNHQYSHQAFAYHIALDGTVIDLGPDSLPVDFTSHVQSRRVTKGNVTVWEARVSLFDSTFQKGKAGQVPMLLEPGMKVGFALAYCDNDRSPERENFLGSMPIPGPDTNRGWKDAGLFTKITLVDVPDSPAPSVKPAAHPKKKKK